MLVLNFCVGYTLFIKTTHVKFIKFNYFHYIFVCVDLVGE